MTYLVPIIIAFIAALGTYLGIYRKASGRIATTEASKLWDEAAEMRKAYLNEIARLRNELTEIRSIVQNCTSRLDALEDENEALEAKNRELEKKIATLQKENEGLRKQNASQQKRIEELESHVS